MEEIYYDKGDNVHCITYNGQTRTLSAWAEFFGYKRSVVANRMRRGWSFEKSITKKVGKYRKKVKPTEKEQ